MDIRILYEDKFIAVCVKPVGMLSEGEGMPAALKARCDAREIYCVHRLDRAVGGVMVYAKTASAAAKLSAAMTQGSFNKQYLAVLHGAPQEDEAVLRDLLFKDSSKNKSFVVTRIRKGVKEAELEYKLLSRKSDMSLVRVTLHTGRSHQIRVQFSSRRMPLVGDVKYGSPRKDCNIALWSERLSFPHPVSGERLSFSAAPDGIFPWNEFE